MKQLIILSQAPFTPQIRRNSYVEKFIKAGYANTKFWDLSQYLHPGIKIVDEMCTEYVSYITTIEDFYEALDELEIKNCIFIVDFNQSLKTKHLFRALSDKNCIYVRVDMYANTYLYISKWRQILKLLSKSFVNIFVNKIRCVLYFLYARKYNIAPFKRYYSSSSLSKVNATDKINHPDYEEFKFSIPNRIINNEYILFVDTYFGYHPDDKYIHKFNLNKVSPEKYHESLRNFFDYLEQKYKQPVIIAAHPKSNYPIGIFGEREIIKYKTKDLVLFADKVILQLCNSVSWVALADKPMIFITTNGYDVFTERKRRLKMLAQILGMDIFNIDVCNWDDINFLNINPVRRKDYIYTYLTDRKIESKQNIDILTESFELL